MTVTFCGHRDVQDTPELRGWLRARVEGLILEGADTFYLGGYGEFDRIAALVVWEMKRKYPWIESVLVQAYLGREGGGGHYDRTMYPEIEGGPMRFAITRRNRWLVDNSDVLIAYVVLDSGGAAAVRRYAVSRHKRVISYEE